MNNNNSSNRNSNRRRGRSNRNQGGGGGGGGNQANRIDSRARGNAPQMLEKYKKLAQDAQHNGDRVQTEYYLQFADHYFRVLADNRTRQDARQEEGRGPRQREERDLDESNEESDFDDRRPAAAANRRPRDRDDNRDDAVRGDRYESRDEPRDRDRNEGSRSSQADNAAEYEPAENPFLRTGDEERPRRAAGKPRQAEAKAAGPRPKREPKPEFDAAVLPPAIGAREASSDDGGEEKPTPRRRARKQDDDGAVSAVG